MTNSKTFTFTRVERLSILKNCLGVDNVSGLKILDYGGNHGNILKDGLENNEIVQSDYTCLDVDKLVLDAAKEEYPDANWIFYNRFNQNYNPTGQKRIPFPFEDDSFDVVFAYSVHSHASYEDIVFDLKEMQRVAKVVCTSILTPDFAKYITMKREYDYGAENLHPDWYTMDEIEKYRYYIDADQVCTTEDEIRNDNDFLLSVFNKDWFLSMHPEISKFIPTKVVPGLAIQPFIIIDG